MKTLSLLLLLPLFLFSQQRGFTEKKLVLNDENGIPQEVKLYDNLYAVIIGIDRYPNLEKNNYLQNAVSDAKGIETVLKEKYPFTKIITLYNGDATRDNILRTLGELKEQTKPNDALFIFFAGHGNTIKRVDGSETGYLLPSDGSFKLEDAYKNLSMSQLRDQMQEIRAKHLLFVADACFSGTLMTRSGEAPAKQDYTYYKLAANEIVRQVLTAGTSTETVLDGGLEGHSVFTGRFIEALQKNSSFISANELGSTIQKRVSGDAMVRNHKQTPQFGRLYGEGDFVFIANEALGVDSEAKLKEELARLQNERRTLTTKKEQAEAEEKAKQEEDIKTRLAALERTKQLEAEERAAREREERERAEEERRKLELKAKIDKEKSLITAETNAMSLEQAEAKITELENKIAADAAEFDRQMQKQIRLEIKDGAKDEFETSSEYRQRLDDAQKVKTKIENEFALLKAQAKKPIQNEIDKLLAQEFPVLRKTKIELIKYSADKEQYTLAVVDVKTNKKISSGKITLPRDEARILNKNKDLLQATLTAKPRADAAITIKEPENNKTYILNTPPKSFTNKLGIEFVLVEGGTFSMGSNDGESDEKPVHTVTVSDFYIGRYEVTQREWKSVMGNNPSSFKGDDLPVESVSWNDVQEFIKKLNELTGENYRLPTEAEWEYAARGGTNWQDNYIYSGSNNVGDAAWYSSNSSNTTHTVGTKQPNQLGIYDMSGNVWEWCSDWYGNYNSTPQNNPAGATSGSYRVSRGGSWLSDASYCRVAYRNDDTPDFRSLYLGFRLACSSK